jgi:hypothetical protein
MRTVCLEGSDGFVSSPRRFDSYWLERPGCRARITLAEDQYLSRGAQVWCPRTPETVNAALILHTLLRVGEMGQRGGDQGMSVSFN